MTTATAPVEQFSADESDVGSLFSRLGAFNGTGQYQELVRQEAAVEASLRWPLLAELQGMLPDDTGSK